MKGAVFFFAVLLAILLPGASFAEDGKWLRAESARFIVYGQGREEQVRRTILDLEAYHELLSLRTGLRSKGPAPKPEVYLAEDHRDLDAAIPGIPRDVRGIYLAEAEMVAAIATFAGKSVLSGAEVVFHEYAHHFMMQHSSYAYPTWYVEGFAEYFAPSRILDDTVEVGVIPDYRAPSLLLGRWLPIKTVLFDSHWQLSSQEAAQFYAESWLLTHYLFADRARADKLLRYLARLNEGAAPIAAFREAFGMEVEALDEDVHAYMKGKLRYTIQPRPEMVSAVTIARLPRAADDLLLLDVRVRSGLESSRGEEALVSIRRHAAEWPGDPFAQRVLARVEIFHGDPAKGVALADAALAANPDDPDWLYLKGTGLLKRGYLDPEERQALYKQGRAALARANRIRPDHVPTLYRYARSFFGGPGEPSENTTNVLARAAELSPQISELAITTSYALMVRNDFGGAVRLLKSVANAPHGGTLAEKARLLLRSAEQGELPQATSSYLSR